MDNCIKLEFTLLSGEIKYAKTEIKKIKTM
jgi:hypothetical protein